MSFFKGIKRKNRFNKTSEEHENELKLQNTISQPSTNEQDDLFSRNFGEIEITQHERNESINKTIMMSQSEFKNIKHNNLIALYIDESDIQENIHNSLFIFKMELNYLSDFLDRRDQKISFDKSFSERNKFTVKNYLKIKIRWKVLQQKDIERLSLSKVEINFKG
jgi:Vacuolar membrane-associated protein Iml1